jgi:hypothetical protein
MKPRVQNFKPECLAMMEGKAQSFDKRSTPEEQKEQKNKKKMVRRGEEG